jgi:hypothetical protein
VKIMAASAKAVHEHLDDLVTSGDPNKREGVTTARHLSGSECIHAEVTTRSKE